VSAQSMAKHSPIPNPLSSFMVSPEFSPTNSHGDDGAARTLCVVGFTRDLKIYSRKIRQF
jgi:hypothetical protein